MFKKILGILFIVAAVLDLAGAFLNGSLLSERAAITLVGVVLYLASGIFFITFDSVYKYDYAKGYKARKIQNIAIVLFSVIYGGLILFAGISAGAMATDSYVMAFIVLVFPYIIPMLIFAGMIGMYVMPYNACKKHFGDNISEQEGLVPYTEKGTILANDKVVFFPRYFCIIPFKSIDSVKLVTTLERDIVFTLANKKKIEFVAGKKQYEGLLAAIKAQEE